MEKAKLEITMCDLKNRTLYGVRGLKHATERHRVEAYIAPNAGARIETQYFSFAPTYHLMIGGFCFSKTSPSL